MRSLAVLTVLAAAAVALSTGRLLGQPVASELASDRVAAQCKLVSTNSVQMRSQQMSLYLCEAADGQFVLAADQLADDVTFDKGVLMKLHQLIRHKRQYFPSPQEFVNSFAVSHATATTTSTTTGYDGVHLFGKK